MTFRTEKGAVVTNISFTVFYVTSGTVSVSSLSLSLCLSLSLSVCLSVCLSLALSLSHFCLPESRSCSQFFSLLFSALLYLQLYDIPNPGAGRRQEDAHDQVSKELWKSSDRTDVHSTDAAHSCWHDAADINCTIPYKHLSKGQRYSVSTLLLLISPSEK